MIHNYRWRLGLETGESQFDSLEATLAKAPAISVPAVTLQGDADGAPHPDSIVYAAKFSGPHLRRQRPIFPPQRHLRCRRSHTFVIAERERKYKSNLSKLLFRDS